ncbi:unnamed protein product [Rotaria sp. Silwood1]|nr:unnamed protein product [Rotaria sp. Silwood1]CAF4962107.1 unnamed protein product [Rotaria sp. Silwood1]
MATVILPDNDFHTNVDDQYPEIFCLIWLDAGANAEDVRDTEQKLRSIINCLKKFQDLKQCQKYIEERSQNERVVMIVSGSLGREIVPSIHKLRQVISIYVYCMDKESNKKWAAKFAKVKAVVVKLDELIARIKDDHKIQKMVEEPLSINIFTTSTGPVPLRASSTDIQPNAKWAQNGVTVAGGNGSGSGINQLSLPWGLYVGDDQTIYVADTSNSRILEWKYGATNGKVVAGGNGEGNGAHQLNSPRDVIIDKDSDSLIISDRGNNRVVRWPRRNGTSGEIIFSNIAYVGLTMDENGSLYVVDEGKHEVRRYKTGDTQEIVVAGGNGKGNCLDKLSNILYVFVDRDHSVYVSDCGNHRVMKWEEGAKQGIVVAGGQGYGNSLTQLSYPYGVVVDQLGTVYVADYWNDRVMRWAKGATQGSVIAGGNGSGSQSNQLNRPIGLSFDRYGNLYVVDQYNHRIQKFSIE